MCVGLPVPADPNAKPINHGITINEGRRMIALSGSAFPDRVEFKSDVITAERLTPLPSTDSLLKNVKVREHIFLNRITGEYIWSALPTTTDGIELTREQVERAHEIKKNVVFMYRGPCKQANRAF